MNRVTLCVCLATLITPLAIAQPQVTIDLTDVRIQNGLNQSRSSAPDTISPALGYRYAVSGNVQGSGVVLGLLAPTPTPIAQVLEQLAPGSSALLNGEVYNPPGTHPVGVADVTFSGTEVLFGVTVTASATLSAGINADDTASFNLTNVVLTPAALVGSLRFTTGSVVITRVPAITADMNYDGLVNFFDIDPFVLALFDPAAYQSQFGYSELYAGDINRDGVLNFFDIDPFVACIFEGCQ